MKKVIVIAAGASLSLAAASQAQVVVRGMSDNRSGMVSAFANAPNGDPVQSGFNVDPGQNDFTPFDFLLTETDTRQQCSGTQATATVDHHSRFINIDSQMRCRNSASG